MSAEAIRHLDHCQSLRELKTAYTALDKRASRVKQSTYYKEELSWPLVLIDIEIRRRQEQLARACAEWFECRQSTDAWTLL